MTEGNAAAQRCSLWLLGILELCSAFPFNLSSPGFPVLAWGGEFPPMPSLGPCPGWVLGDNALRGANQCPDSLVLVPVGVSAVLHWV